MGTLVANHCLHACVLACMQIKWGDSRNPAAMAANPVQTRSKMTLDEHTLQTLVRKYLSDPTKVANFQSMTIDEAKERYESFLHEIARVSDRLNINPLAKAIRLEFACPLWAAHCVAVSIQGAFKRAHDAYLQFPRISQQLKDDPGYHRLMETFRAKGDRASADDQCLVIDSPPVIDSKPKSPERRLPQKQQSGPLEDTPLTKARKLWGMPLPEPSAIRSSDGAPPHMDAISIASSAHEAAEPERKCEDHVCMQDQGSGAWCMHAGAHIYIYIFTRIHLHINGSLGRAPCTPCNARVYIIFVHDFARMDVPGDRCPPKTLAK